MDPRVRRTGDLDSTKPTTRPSLDAGPFDSEAPDPSEAVGWGPVDVADRLIGTILAARLDRRRASFLFGTFATAWIVLLFARQVGDAAAATATAESLRAENAAIAARVEALQAERLLVAQPGYVAQQARAYELGGARERAFALAPDASPLPADAPGSAALRLGAHSEPASNLEVWLRLLFGPARG